MTRLLIGYDDSESARAAIRPHVRTAIYGN